MRLTDEPSSEEVEGRMMKNGCERVRRGEVLRDGGEGKSYAFGL